MKQNRLFLVKPVMIVFLIFLLLLQGCDSSPNTQTPDDQESLESTITRQEDVIEELSRENESLLEQVNTLETQVEALEEQLSQPSSGSLLITAQLLVEKIAAQDFQAIAQYVDPDEGLRFSPYGHVRVDDDQVWLPEDLQSAMEDSTVYTWGAFDGTGDPIDKTFGEYYDRFIYDQDFASPHMIGNNTVIGTGNTLNNLEDVYPDADFVEFHFTGFDPQYEGMDWRSLRLVMKDENGQWVLQGIVHDEWTI